MGRRAWAIAEGYIPGASTGPEPAMTSHETACLLNTTDREARVEITIFFADQEPAGPYRVVVPAKRTRHVRFNDLTEPTPIPGTPTTPASSPRTCPSSCSTHGSIHVRPPTP